MSEIELKCEKCGRTYATIIHGPDCYCYEDADSSGDYAYVDEYGDCNVCIEARKCEACGHEN